MPAAACNSRNVGGRPVRDSAMCRRIARKTCIRRASPICFCDVLAMFVLALVYNVQPQLVHMRVAHQARVGQAQQQL
jgi:hypothetical protein